MSVVSATKPCVDKTLTPCYILLSQPYVPSGTMMMRMTNVCVVVVDDDDDDETPRIS